MEGIAKPPSTSNFFMTFPCRENIIGPRRSEETEKDAGAIVRILFLSGPIRQRIEAVVSFIQSERMAYDIRQSRVKARERADIAVDLSSLDMALPRSNRAGKEPSPSGRNLGS